MNPAIWIAIYLPIFITLLITIPNIMLSQRRLILKHKKKGGYLMTNEMIKECIGKFCTISTGSYGSSFKGKVVDVQENWVKIDVGGTVQLVNAEYVQTIKVHPQKTSI